MYFLGISGVFPGYFRCITDVKSMCIYGIVTSDSHFCHIVISLIVGGKMTFLTDFSEEMARCCVLK